MKLKYIGESDPCSLIYGKEYECLGEEQDYYRVVDEEGMDEDEEIQGYLYPKKFFEVIN